MGRNRARFGPFLDPTPSTEPSGTSTPTPKPTLDPASLAMLDATHLFCSKKNADLGAIGVDADAFDLQPDSLSTRIQK